MSWAEGIPWAIAALGWGATHLLSDGRERRKDTRSQIDKIHEHIAKLESEAKDFHTSENHSPAKAYGVLAKMNMLERLLMRVPILSMDNLHPYIIGINRACTLNNFDASVFHQLDYYDNILQEITAAVQDMEDELERQYSRRYANSFMLMRLDGKPK